MKLIPVFTWLVPVIVLVALGLGLINQSHAQEKQAMLGYEMHNAASQAFVSGDFKTAYTLYIQSAYELEDPSSKAQALYEAATVGWAAEIADYNALVGLYQQALRFDPDHYEASFNLEYLYWLKANAPDSLPEPKPGPMPSRQEEPTSGDI